MNEGARVIGVAGVPPFGCLPIVITIDSGDALQPRRCIESYSAVAREYNSLLQRLLKTMEIDGTKLFYVDIYSPINDMIQNPIKYGEQPKIINFPLLDNVIFQFLLVKIF